MADQKTANVTARSITAKNTLFKKYNIWYWTIFILALSGNFSVSAANMPNSQELIQQLGIQQQDFASLNQGEIVFLMSQRLTKRN
jgi:hypothetical protein